MPQNKREQESTKDANAQDAVPESIKEANRQDAVPESTKEVNRQDAVPESTKEANRQDAVQESTKEANRQDAVADTINREQGAGLSLPPDTTKEPSLGQHDITSGSTTQHAYNVEQRRFNVLTLNRRCSTFCACWDNLLPY